MQIKIAGIHGTHVLLKKSFYNIREPYFLPRYVFRGSRTTTFVGPPRFFSIFLGIFTNTNRGMFFPPISYSTHVMGGSWDWCFTIPKNVVFFFQTNRLKKSGIKINFIWTRATNVYCRQKKHVRNHHWEISFCWTGYLSATFENLIITNIPTEPGSLSS